MTIEGHAGFSGSVFLMLLSPEDSGHFSGGKTYHCTQYLYGHNLHFKWLPPWPGDWVLTAWNRGDKYVMGQAAIRCHKGG
jgi:hypothetical protein